VATSEQVKALLRSHASGDDTTFYSVALQVAARAARSGQTNVALELRELIDSLRAHTPPSSRTSAPVPVVQPRGELAGLLSARFPKTRLSDLVLQPDLKDALQRVLVEQRQQERLRGHGFAPLRKLLLLGAPGTGKTLSASALAGELGLPLLTIRLDGLITKFMGETAAKLRLVFDALRDTRGVYLFDEVDALAGERALANDVGEIRRVLNSFLQFIEHDDSDSLLVAATNHPQLLDTAMFRRFDAVIRYPLPDGRVVRIIVENRLANVPRERITWAKVQAAAVGLSHGEITLATERAAKDAILGPDGTAVTTERLVAALQERRASTAEKRQETFE
jgi:SpoVK/Ycf46/Vps4 family AAA+-type ATPase